MPHSLITFEIEDRVGLIRLNRPDDGNALIPEMARELLDAAIRCDEDPDLRAVVLTGNGKDVLRRWRPQGFCRSR
jgi:enoyl-CoA hydratase/carnithine racemase